MLQSTYSQENANATVSSVGINTDRKNESIYGNSIIINECYEATLNGYAFGLFLVRF